MIRLGPLIDEMPVVGGLTAYFNDSPELDMTFTGVGDWDGVMGIFCGAVEKGGFPWPWGSPKWLVYNGQSHEHG